MLSFWRAIFYSSFLAPLFKAVASAMGVTPQVCKEYCTSGMMLYGWEFLLIVLLVFALIFAVRLFGWLNGGNGSKYDPATMPKIENSPLKDKNITFLGSSVTKGFAAKGVSFVDMIAAQTGAKCLKEAVSGTTLVDNGAKSYISRMKTLDTTKPCDLFVCQLSTNDATKNLPLGKIEEGKDLSSFDTKTICGAIEYVIAYAKEKWNCPVAFYTNPEYASDNYMDMVEALAKIAEKWDVPVIDFWHDAEINEKSSKVHSSMNDQIHPTKKGYQAWTPVIEAALSAIMEGKALPERKVVEPAVTKEAVASAKSSRNTGKIIKRILLALLAFLLTMAGSTVKQLVTVTGLKNEGNSDEYAPESVTPTANSPIKGKNLLWLGSSVFQGFGSGKTSPALYIDAMDGTTSVIEVKGGTFLATFDGTLGGGNNTSIAADSSYTNRLRTHNKETDPNVDLVVVQLSTNDSKGQCPTGEVTPGKFEFEDFDLSTTAGSLEAITAYARDTWDAKVLVITGTYFEDEMTYTGGQKQEIYLNMIEKCHEIEDKWGGQFAVLDLWHNDKVYEGIVTGDKLWRSYMSDAIHPTKKGYRDWWCPFIEEKLFEVLK